MEFITRIFSIKPVLNLTNVHIRSRCRRTFVTYRGHSQLGQNIENGCLRTNPKNGVLDANECENFLKVYIVYKSKSKMRQVTHVVRYGHQRKKRWVIQYYLMKWSLHHSRVSQIVVGYSREPRHLLQIAFCMFVVIIW